MDKIVYRKVIRNSALTYLHRLTTNPDNTQHGSYLNPRYQLYYLLSGDISYSVEGESYNLNEGDLLIFNNKEIHRPYFLSDKKYERILIFFTNEFFSHYQSDVYPITKYFENKKPGSFNVIKAQYLKALNIEEKFAQIETYIQENKAYCDLLIEMEVIHLIIELNNIIEKSEEVANLDYNHDEKFEQIIRYINENYTNRLTINDIVEMFFINKYHFSHQFKKVTGLSFKDYVTKKRIAKATELLRLHIKPFQVASMTGFEDYSNFYRAFKKIEKVSPSKY